MALGAATWLCTWHLHLSLSPWAFSHEVLGLGGASSELQDGQQARCPLSQPTWGPAHQPAPSSSIGDCLAVPQCSLAYRHGGLCGGKLISQGWDDDGAQDINGPGREATAPAVGKPQALRGWPGTLLTASGTTTDRPRGGRGDLASPPGRSGSRGLQGQGSAWVKAKRQRPGCAAGVRCAQLCLWNAQNRKSVRAACGLAKESTAPSDPGLVWQTGAAPCTRVSPATTPD